jgi:very-short-patch-repair endonuclease
MSPPEATLWNILRARPNGFKFRRQHPLGPFVLDFYCREALLAIEVDGFAHQLGDNPQRDEARDQWLARQGISTLRIDALDVRNNLEGVLVFILERCSERTPPPHFVRSPSPAAAGED